MDASRHNPKRKTLAFTMVEMLIATSIFALVFGIAAELYVHVSWRTANAMESAKMIGQVRDLDKYLENTVGNAVTCSVINIGLPLVGPFALRCQMPTTGANTDQYGTYNSFTPANCTNGAVHWGLGKYRWIYLSNANGNPGTAGTYLWVVENNAAGAPDVSHQITNFTYYGGNTSHYNWPLIDSFTFSVNSGNDTVTYTIHASDLFGQGTSLNGSTDTADSRSLQLTRTVYWRHSIS